MILKQNIMVDNILDAISCSNNCKYLSIKSLLIDISVMLSYADLLVDEDIVNNIILVNPEGQFVGFFRPPFDISRLSITYQSVTQSD